MLAPLHASVPYLDPDLFGLLQRLLHNERGHLLQLALHL